MTLYRSNNYSWGGDNDDRYQTQGFIYNPYGETPTPEIKKDNKFPWVLYARKIRNRQSLKNYR